MSAITLVFLLSPWAAAAPGALPPAQPLHFLLATIEPLRDPLPAGMALPPSGGVGPYIVQFVYPLRGEEKPRLESLGAEVAGYVPDGGFVVVAAPGVALAARSLDGVRFVGAIPASLRLDPSAVGAERVTVLTAGDAALAAKAIAALGATPLVASRSVLVAIPGPGGARALANLPHVLWVEPYAAPTPANYHAVITDGLRQNSNGSSYSPAAGAMWTFNPDPLNPSFLGYTGAGVAVDVTDQGIDGTHPAFSGRLGAGRSWVGGSAWVDPLGHGTHVAASALGDGGYFAGDSGLAGLYAGAAPGATLVAQVYNRSALDYAGMADFAATAGARVSLNSWGDTTAASLGAYTTAASAYDGLTADSTVGAGVRPLLFVFSAGNMDNQPGSVTPPATAKNVLSVGATGNDYAGGTAADDIAAFSAFGPTDDGRIKPDLVAPGERVASANSSQDATAGTPPLPPSAGRSYVYLSGTSMAAPQVAGAAAVATGYLESARGVAATPALLKALLINGAEPLAAFPWPGPEQGWGRLDVGASLLNSSARRVDFVPEGFRTFFSAPDVVQYNLSVSGGSEFKVTLVWTDAAGTPLAGSALVNDLDLEVRDAADSVIFTGNQFNGSYSAPGAGAVFDRTNNVEVVRIANASAGVWKVFVRAYNLPVAPQSFALAFAGAIDRSYADLAVAPVGLQNAPASVESGDGVTVDGEVANDGSVAASNISLVAVPAADPLATPMATVAIPALQPGERQAFSLSFFPPDGANAVLIRASSDSAELDMSNNWATLEFFVARRQPDLTGVTDQSAPPGQQVVFALTVANRGNAPERIVVTEATGVRDPAWALAFSRTQFDLDPGGVAPLQVFISVPASAQAGDLTAADIGVVSSANSSHTSFLGLTARAATVHALRLEPLVPALSLPPGGRAVVPVRVTNLGNVEEAVTATLVAEWSPSAEWTGDSQVAVIAAGQTTLLSLEMGNEDLGAGGYRGEARVRVVLSSNGAFFDARLPVFVQNVVCLKLRNASSLQAVIGPAASGSADLVLENCGSVALEGTLEAQAPAEVAITLAPAFSVAPHSTIVVPVGVAAAGQAADGVYPFTVHANAGAGIDAALVLSFAFSSGVELELVGPAPLFAAAAGPNTFAVRVHNAGAAGWVRAPAVGEVPAGWIAAIVPERFFMDAGAVSLCLLLVDTGDASTANTADVRLTFFAGSAREGDFTPTVRIQRVAASGAATPPTSVLTDVAPAAAAVVGVVAALAAASMLAPSRGLLRACPSCGRKAPRFDTFMNPTCTKCGASLERTSTPPR